MTRRRSIHQDSLELLLDTICNTFGGVLFIAILVVMLLRQTGQGQTASPPPPVSPAELESLTDQLEVAAADLARQRENHASQVRLIAKFAPKEVRALLEQRIALTAQQDELQLELSRLRTRNAETAASIEAILVENSQVREDLREAAARNLSAKTDLVRERNARVEEVRLPVVRPAAAKREIGLVLRYGRLYVWHRYGPGNIRLGLNTEDFAVISETGDSLETRPIPTRGIVLDDQQASRDAVLATLRRFDPKTCYLTVVVRPDSYRSFRHFRDRSIELGFDYRVMAVDVDSPVADRGGSGGKVQ